MMVSSFTTVGRDGATIILAVTSIGSQERSSPSPGPAGVPARVRWAGTVRASVAKGNARAEPTSMTPKLWMRKR